MNIICPVCESGEVRRWTVKSNFDIYACRRCTHKFADLGVGEPVNREDSHFREVVTNGLMASDQLYYEHLRKDEARGQAPNVEYALDLCAVHGVNRGRWLDVGCGAGNLLSAVRGLGFDPIGVEPGGWGQIAARERGLRIIKGFLGDDTFPSRFDVVSATDVVEHVADPVSFLRRMGRYVEDAGCMIISIPFADSLEARVLGKHWDMIAPPTHQQFFSKVSLDLALRRAGLVLADGRRFNVRNLGGLLRSRLLRRGLDFLIAGPQLVCLIRKQLLPSDCAK